MRTLLIITLSFIASSCGEPKKTTEDDSDLLGAEQAAPAQEIVVVLPEPAGDPAPAPAPEAKEPPARAKAPENPMALLSNTELGNAMAIVVGENCVSCHYADNPDELSDLTVVDNMVDLGGAIVASIEDGSMPQDQVLSDLELNIAAAWGNAKYPAPELDTSIVDAAASVSQEDSLDARIDAIICDAFGKDSQQCKDRQ